MKRREFETNSNLPKFTKIYEMKRSEFETNSNLPKNYQKNSGRTKISKKKNNAKPKIANESTKANQTKTKAD